MRLSLRLSSISCCLLRLSSAKMASCQDCPYESAPCQILAESRLTGTVSARSLFIMNSWVSVESKRSPTDLAEAKNHKADSHVYTLWLWCFIQGVTAALLNKAYNSGPNSTINFNMTDLGVQCLPFCMHLSDTSLHCKTILFHNLTFFCNYFLVVPSLRIFMVFK